MGRKPVRIDAMKTSQLKATLKLRKITVPEGIELYVTDTKCGRYMRKNANITVPVWAVVRSHTARSSTATSHDPEYAIYYACHEIAHAMTPDSRVRGVMHSPEFYVAFKEVCPKHLWHYETGYKPNLAAAAGIKTK